ncbi:MAG: RCC1 domain-containing protein, partial [Actinomycetes bacterium]
MGNSMATVRRSAGALLTTCVLGSLLGFTAATVQGVTPAAPSASAAPAQGASYASLAAPCRAVDTRNQPAGRVAGATAPNAFGSRTFQVGGVGITGQGGAVGGCGIPETATAVELTVTVTGALATGFLRVAPNTGATPTATFLNFQAGVGISNTGTVTLSSAQPADLAVFNFSAAGTHVVIEVQGYFQGTGDQGFTSLGTPCRAVDTRNQTAGRVAGATGPNPFGTRGVRLAGSNVSGQGGVDGGCGIPTSATAVEATVTVTGALASGFLRITPAGLNTVPTATFLNFQAGISISNTGTLAITDGLEDLFLFNFSSAGAHVVIDIHGYFSPASTSGYSPLATPCRVVDSRSTTAGRVAGATNPNPFGRRNFQVGGFGFDGQGGAAGGCAVPETANAVELTVTVTGALSDGFLRLDPNSGTTPSATFLNYRSGVGISNTGTLPLSRVQPLDLAVFNFAAAGAHVVIEVQGFWSNTRPLTGGSSLSAGSFHTCVRVTGGALECWGYTGDGDPTSSAGGLLGNGLSTSSGTPVRVSGLGLTGAVQVDAGRNHSCARMATGQVRCWGQNTFGQLGNDTTTNSAAPVTVQGLTGIVDVTVGENHSCALNSSGTVFCWGSNGALQLGQEDATLTALVPVAVSGSVVGVSGVTGIEAGSKFTCVLTNNSGIRGASCWGADILDPTPAIILGRVFVDTTLRARTVGDLSLVDKIVDISAGRGHACVLLVDGTVRCWGLGDIVAEARTCHARLPVQA